MHISWSYLDKRKATIDAIESYYDMEHIIKHTDEEIIRMENRIMSVGSPNMDGLPHAHDPRNAENVIVNTIDEIDVLKERYRQAKEFMDWFTPAWEKLSEEERYILGVWHMDGVKRAADAVASHYRIERSSAYNAKNRALGHLTTLLYGKS